MATKEQIDEMQIDDTQICAELDDYEDLTLIQLARVIQKYKNKINKIKTHTDKIDCAKNFDYSVIYDDIVSYSKKYGKAEADRIVRRKYIQTIRTHLQPVIEYYEELTSKSFEANKQKNLIRLKEKINCECGREVAYVHMKRHKMSEIHKKNISILSK
tara:strand:- start:523 stop:996 length:474 start_codon:yes stop_codon:yes gene_type:complete